MFRRIALALLSLVVVGCTSAPVRTTASQSSVGMKKMSLEDIFIDDSEEKLADDSGEAPSGYQAETTRPYDPAGDNAAH